MQVLVILNQPPELHNVAMVEMTEEEYAYLSKAHNYTVNYDPVDDEKIQAVITIQSAFSEGNTEYEGAIAGYLDKWKDVPIPEDISQAEKLINCCFPM